MARRRHELDAEASQVKHDGVENVDIRFASIASAGADLPELERAAQECDEGRRQGAGRASGADRFQDQVALGHWSRGGIAG